MPVALVTALIIDRPLCIRCLADKATSSPELVEQALARITHVLTLHRVNGRCHACGGFRSVYYIDRAPN